MLVGGHCKHKQILSKLCEIHNRQHLRDATSSNVCVSKHSNVTRLLLSPLAQLREWYQQQCWPLVFPAYASACIFCLSLILYFLLWPHIVFCVFDQLPCMQQSSSQQNYTQTHDACGSGIGTSTAP